MTDVTERPPAAIARDLRPHAESVAPAVPAADKWQADKRLTGLTRFAISITVLNVVGHLFLGFEQSWITPFVALAAAYTTELVGETCEAFAAGRRPRYAGSVADCVRFLLSAHISGLAVAMLLYACDQLAPVAFAASVAIASKYVLRVRVAAAGGRAGMRHFLNPSNFAITVTLLLFPMVSIAPPYQFTENTSGVVDWLLPLVVIGTGSWLNIKATGRAPLILAWLVAFAVQALLRSALAGTPALAGLMPMTGFAFILFTFYMITDPATTPARPRDQVWFAIAVAALYGLFMHAHVVFGLFYALTAIAAVRGVALFVAAHRARSIPAPAPL